MTNLDSPPDRLAGFTLLEILAVLLIGALLMSFMVPNLSALGSRDLESEAKKLVATIDLGRQRSVMTGSPHRLVIDIENNRYGLEWELTEGPDAPTHRVPDDLTFSSDDPSFTRSDEISLAPPPTTTGGSFSAVPGLMGRFEALPEKIGFKGVETTGGWVSFGEVAVRFERDGSASYSTIVLASANGGEVQLEILPLADSVGIEYEEP